MSETTAEGQLRIEYLPLSSLTRWPRNPKEHDLGEIGASFERFGYVAPLIIDETSGRLVAGHGRLDELEALRTGGAKPPDRIRAEGEEWLVPVVRGISFKGEDDAAAYVIADNQHTIRGGWDEKKLAACLKDLNSLEGTGFTKKGLAKLLKGLDSGSGASDQSDGLRTQYMVLIDCEGEQHQTQLLDRFLKEGLTCRALTS